jgi:hypothetical protein
MKKLEFSMETLYIITIVKISAGANGGIRSRVCLQWSLCSDPHQHQRKFFAAHVFGGQQFWELKPHAKFQNPFWERSIAGREGEELNKRNKYR